MATRTSPTSPKLNRRTFIGQSALALGALTGAGALLDACGSSSAANGKTTITVMINRAEFTQAQQTLFEQTYPNITVNQIEYDATVLSARFAAGNPPDVIRTNFNQIPYYVARGIAENLDPYFAKSKVINVDDLLPVNDQYRYDGKTQGQGPRYGMVKDWSPDNMFWYNTNVFKAAGVTPPDPNTPLSYNDLLTIGKKLTVRDGNKIKVYGYDPSFGFVTQGHFIQMLAQRGKSLWNSDFTKVSLTDPDGLDVIQWYVDWAQAHIGISPLDPDTTGSSTLLENDRLGIENLGYWFGGVLYNDLKGLPAQFGLAAAPQFGTAQRVNSCMTGTGAFIPTASPRKDAAWTFYEFFFGGPPTIDRATSGFGLPAFKSLLAKLPQSSPAQQEAFNTINTQLQYVTVQSYGPYVSDNAFEAAVAQILTPAFQGQISVAAAAKQLENAINLLASQGKEQIG